jgi:hypothetical protein
MPPRNALFAVPPFVSPTIIGTSTERPQFPAANILTPTKPFQTWHTTNTTTFHTCDFAVDTGVEGIFLTNVNYPIITIGKRVSGEGVYRLGTPNILLRSHRGDLTPWTSSGVTFTTDDADGPDKRIKAQKLAYASAGASIDQSRDISASAANKKCSFDIWLKRITGTLGLTMRIASTGGGTFDKVISLNKEWTLYSHSATIGAGASTNSIIFSLIGTGTGAVDVHFGGANALIDSLLSAGAVYETTGTGLVVPKDGRVNRRKLLLRFQDSLTGIDEIRLTINGSQTTDGGESFYSTGGILFTTALRELGGLYQFPIDVTVSEAVNEARFESGGREILTLGPSRAVVMIRGQFLSRETDDDLFALATSRAGLPILLAENFAVGGVKGTVDLSTAYLCYRRSVDTNYRLSHPEISETAIEFEEII